MFKLQKSLLRKRRKNESNFKYVLSLFHLWLGLFSAIIIFIVCLTGCLYAFKTQIENIVYKDFQFSEVDNSPEISKAVKNFENQFGTPSFLIYNPEKQRSLEISSLSKLTQGVHAYYNPDNATLIGQQGKKLSHFFYVVLEIHRWMMVENPGKLIVGIFVLIFIYMLLSGLYMWIPKKRKDLKRSLSIRMRFKFYRLNYDLHKVFGFYASIFLLLISLTGLYVSFHWVKNLMVQSLGGPSISISEVPGQSAMSQEISDSFNATFNDLLKNQEIGIEKKLNIDDLILKSQKELPGSGRMKIWLPNNGGGEYFSFHKYGNTLLSQSVYDELVLNAFGEVKQKSLYSDLPLYKKFMLIAKPLHTGEIFGTPSVLIYFIASLVGCLLPITGFIIWWKKVT